MKKRREKNSWKKSGAGFTLIETLVAISIITVAMTGPLSITSKSLTSARMAKERVTASYLAQDAMEYIRAKRDANILSNAGNWLSGMSGCVSSTGNTKCTVDTVGNRADDFVVCGGTCPPLKYSKSTGFYHHGTGGQPTKFIRWLTMERINDHEVAVSVAVKWSGTFHDYSFTFRENMLNWWQ